MYNTTPMMKQYWEIKNQHRDAILFFRLGDFYEMFSEDAVVASKVLNIALTTRNKNSQNQVPLCGVPHHSAKSYIAKLTQSGYKVAICDQIEDPKTAKGIVKRAVSRVITPGLAEDFLEIEGSDSSFLAACFCRQGLFMVVYMDYSTGEFRATSTDIPHLFVDELAKIDPKEILIARAMDETCTALLKTQWPTFLKKRYVNFVAEQEFQTLARDGWLSLTQNMETPTFITLEGRSQILSTANALLSYVTRQMGDVLTHVRTLSYYVLSDALILDDRTTSHLECFESSSQRSRQYSLLWAIDRTSTRVGSRKLKSWLKYPLTKIAEISKRLEAVETLVDEPILLANLRDHLRSMSDLERLNGKIATETVNPRELLSLKETLLQIAPIAELLSNVDSVLLCELREQVDALPALTDLLSNALACDPPGSMGEGRVFREGYLPAIDELILLENNSRQVLLELETRERDLTGIPTLKIKYNKVFGYYIEVSKARTGQVPDRFTRKQTTVGGERFITPELKTLEEKILSAAAERLELQKMEFANLCAKIGYFCRAIQTTAEALATLDVLNSMATLAREQNYTKPVLTEKKEIRISDGRHPVVEQTQKGGRFIPNDILLDEEKNTILILTGPNMAGKSTLMRQVALITLLAHMGSFVPAASAEIGLTDRIFTRIGACDNLAMGDSTFMVEMRETATILHQATSRSLILMDEIGRGTSTYDGISLAWAIAEFISSRIGARTIFATHYHELTDLAAEKDNIQNFNIGVREYNGEIIFIRTLLPGPASMSYGVQVAALAGIPDTIIFRAKEILCKLEEEAVSAKIAHEDPPPRGFGTVCYLPQKQLELFPLSTEIALSRKLAALDINSLTPLQGLVHLAELKKMLEGA